MKKTAFFLIGAIAALMLIVSCGTDPFFHTVTIKSEDKVVATVVVNGNEKYTLPSKVDGIDDIEGWMVDGTEYKVGDSIDVKGDITITAIIGTPVVITLYDEVTETVYLRNGETEITLPEAPKREGYDFDGWDVDGTKAEPGEMVSYSENLEIKARWVKLVSITVDNGDGTERTVQVRENATEFTLPAAPAERAGYVFDGWDVGGTTYKAGTVAPYTKGMGEITAVWTKLYTVTYYNDAALVDTASFRKGEGITLKTGEGLSKGELSFAGWSEKNNAGKADFAGGAVYNEDKDITLYAVWVDEIKKLTYVLTDFDGNYEGSFKDSSVQTVIEDVEKVTLLNESDLNIPTGASFDGWYTEEDKDGNRKYYKGGDEITITGDTKVYANWTDNNLEYVPSNSTDSTVKVSAKVKDASAYKISSWFEGDKVTVIGEEGFKGNTNLTSITLPDTIKTISEQAFSGCNELTSCNLPDGLETIGNNAFRACDLTGKVVIPSSVKSLGESCFHENKNLTSVEFEDGCQITEIPYGAFWGCGLTSFSVLPTTVTKIGVSAFRYCKSIIRVDIPDSVTEIGNGAFGDCSALVEVNIGTGIADIHDCAFCDCTNLLKISIKKSAKDIKGMNGFAKRWSSDGGPNYNTDIKVYDASGAEVTASSGN